MYIGIHTHTYTHTRTHTQAYIQYTFIHDTYIQYIYINRGAWQREREAAHHKQICICVQTHTHTYTSTYNICTGEVRLRWREKLHNKQLIYIHTYTYIYTPPRTHAHTRQ